MLYLFIGLGKSQPKDQAALYRFSTLGRPILC